MRIVQIPILRDNYAHLVIDDATGRAAAIDPADPDPVIARVEAECVDLTHILCTHHHWDHAGGNAGMLARFPDLEVVASADDAPRVDGVTREVGDGDRLAVGELEGRVLCVPCHTRGHVAYLFGDALFCGDTLFVAGCGRFFEGDAAQMDQALHGAFGALPDATRVYCGHEYTVANLRFALTVEPDNAASRAKMAWAMAERAAGRSTVPSTLGEERAFNPFMRVREPTVAAATGASGPVEVMAALRRMKNDFKG